MNTTLNLHDIIALLEDLPTQHFETGQRLLLRRGQIGTVVTLYNDNTYEIEFANPDGHTYALLPVKEQQLMQLRNAPECMAA